MGSYIGCNSISPNLSLSLSSSIPCVCHRSTIGWNPSRESPPFRFRKGSIAFLGVVWLHRLRFRLHFYCLPGPSIVPCKCQQTWWFYPWFHFVARGMDFDVNLPQYVAPSSCALGPAAQCRHFDHLITSFVGWWETTKDHWTKIGVPPCSESAWQIGCPFGFQLRRPSHCALTALAPGVPGGAPGGDAPLVLSAFLGAGHFVFRLFPVGFEGQLFFFPGGF